MRGALIASLTVLCGLLVAVGAGMVYRPAGLIVGGLLGLGGLYVWVYVRAQEDRVARALAQQGRR